MLAADRTLGSRFCILMTDGPSLGLAPLLAKEIFNVNQKINRMEPLTTIRLKNKMSRILWRWIIMLCFRK